MNILTFDTATDIMHVVLGNEAEITDSRIIKTTEQHYNSAFLVSTIADIVKNNLLSMQDINLIGVNIGPGSFTGLRASVTVARVIAQQLGISAVGVPSMQIYSMLNTTDKKSFCLMDARRGMAFVGIYDENSEPVLEPCIMETEKALAMAKEADYFLITDDCIKDDTNAEKFGEFLWKLTVKNNKNSSWESLKPLYIQTPPVHVKIPSERK